MSIKLTEEQRQIVEHPTGAHAKVLAVAGSGKTFTMGHRIKYLVEHRGIPPRKIRALMFNRLAKEEFEQRLGALGFGNRQVKVSTFHGFAYKFINWMVGEGFYPQKQYWIGELEEKSRMLLHEVIRSMRNRNILPPKEAQEIDIDELRTSFSLYKNSLIAPEHAGHSHDPFIPMIFKEYEAARRYKNALTFDDFMPEVVHAFEKHEEIRRIWVGKSDYLIVDEYQDVNYGQQRLIELLAGDHSEVMVVGDDDQTIYEWRGARPTHIISEFQDIFKNKAYREYKLSNTFRFGPILAQSAQNLIQRNTNRVDKTVFAFNIEKQTDINLYEAPANAMMDLHKSMVQEIIRLVKNVQTPPSEIWVIGRMYSQLLQMEIELWTRTVPYKVLDGTPFFKRSECQKLLYYLETSNNFYEKCSRKTLKDLKAILNYPNRKISRTTFLNFIDEFFDLEGHKSIESFFKILIDAKRLHPEAQEELEKFYGILKKGKQILNETELHGRNGKALEMIYLESGLKKHFDNYFGDGQDSYERKLMVMGLIEYAKSLSLDCNSFLHHINSLDTTQGAPPEQLITLSTIHKTKGLEFSYVFIPSCTEGFTPSLYNEPSFIFDTTAAQKNLAPSDPIDNERRLFYVAMTRAKNALYLAVPSPSNDSKEKPSRFIEEIVYKHTLNLLYPTFFLGSSSFPC